MRRVKLSKITEHVRNGKSIKNSSDGSGLPITRIETISDGTFNENKLGYGGVKDVGKIGDYWLQDGDILMSHINSPKHLGKTALYEKNDLDIIHGMNLLGIRPIKNEVLPDYLNYYFLSKDFDSYIKSISNQSVNQASFAASKLKKLKVPLPSLSEQKAIVAKLDRAQRLIDIDKEMLAKYDDLIQSVFLEMFGDPVMNPKGLPQKNIKEIGEVITGNTPPKKNPENYGSEIEWVKTTNIIDEQLYPTTAEEYLSKQGKELGRIIPKNSLIVCCIAGSLSSIGKCSIVDRKIAINQQINAIVPNSEIIDTTFLYAQLLTGKKLIQDASTKSMKGMVSKSKFQKIELLLPDINAQQKFSTFFNKVGKEKLKLRVALKKSKELFSSLVQGAFG